MSTNITLKRSSVQNKVPTTTDLALGEIALNTYDGKLFLKKNVGGTESIVQVGSRGDTALQPSDLTNSLLALWVDPNGSDTAAGNSINYPLKTIGAAVAKAVPGTVILVQAGTYTETCPIVLPRNVSVVGSNLRSVTVKPTTATKFNNMWLVDSGNYLSNMTFSGHQSDAWAVAFNSAANNTAIGASGLGAYIFKSPYIQNCTSYTASDDAGTAGSVSAGATGGGMLVDGASCAPNSPIRSMVVDSYTFVNLNGPGCLVTNDAYAQLVSCFGTFCSYHVKTTLGGQVSITNSTTDFGTYGLIANGRSATALFQGTSGGASIGASTINVTSLTTNRLGNSNKPNTGQVFNVGSNYYTISASSVISGGYTVTFYPALTTASTASSTISFYQRSQISTGAHNMEYVGSGTNYNALPWNGGIPIPANQIVEESGGRVFFSSTDELGNFKVGSQFAVNGTTGEVTINSSSISLSGVSQIGPFSRDGGITQVGVILKEVSSNTSLFASTGTRDINTVPTQSAVYNYLLNNYAPLTGATLTNATLAGTLTANGSVGTAGQFLTTSTTGTYWSTVIANTNLTLASNSSTISVNSDTGTDVTILAANSTTAGVLTATDQTISGIKTFNSNTVLATVTAGLWNGTVIGTAYGGTGQTTLQAGNAAYNTPVIIVTSSGTTTLTNSSVKNQIFSGVNTQTVVLPATSTLSVGWTFSIKNRSTGVVTVNASGGGSVITIPSGMLAIILCIGTAGAGAASDWDATLDGFYGASGNGLFIATTSNPSISNITLSGTLTANSSVGTAGQLLKSSGTGVYWESPTPSTATYNATIGDGTATSFTVTHSLNKANIFVSVRDVSTGYFVYPDIRYTSTNAVVLEFVDPPTSGQYYVAVIGA